MTQTRLYSTQTHKNRIGFVSCSRVVSNFVSPNCEQKENDWKLTFYIWTFKLELRADNMANPFYPEFLEDWVVKFKV